MLFCVSSFLDDLFVNTNVYKIIWRSSRNLFDFFLLLFFKKIAVTDQHGHDYKKYNLFAYSEGKYIERARAMKFTGIPILFIPGHGGSFKQGWKFFQSTKYLI